MYTRKEAIALVKAARHVFTYISLNNGDGRAVKTVKSSVLETLRSCYKGEKFELDQVNTLDNGFDLYIA